MKRRSSHEALAAMILALAVPLGAQDSSEAAVNKLRAHMREALDRQPNFTCVETIDRSVRAQREFTFRPRDTVRLEVALVNHREIFALPGASEFSDESLRAFVPSGMFGNGNFGLYSAATVQDPRAGLAYRGETEQDRRTEFQFDFRLPPDVGMNIRTVDAEANVAYRGSLYADAKTFDVEQLDFAAEEMPVRLGLREATGSVWFAHVRIGESEVLLPSSSELVMTNWMGDTFRNRITFSECREYTGKSTLTFAGDSSIPSSSGRPSKREIRIPENLAIVIRLAGEMNTDDMAVGHPVSAVLDQDLKADGAVLLPKGTRIEGKLERLTPLGNSLVLGFIFQEAESETGQARLVLNFERASGSDLLPLPTARLSPNPHEATVRLRPGLRRLGRDIRLYWRT